METVSCGTCGQKTDFTGTKKCNGCWEVEMRLDQYLAKGGKNARDFVEGALTLAKRNHFFPDFKGSS